MRYDPRTGEEHEMLALSEEVRMAPDGRHLSVGVNQPGVATRILTISFETGEVTSRDLRGEWDLLPLGGSRYLVLESYRLQNYRYDPTLPPGSFAIIDLEEGRVGYLPPISAP